MRRRGELQLAQALLALAVPILRSTGGGADDLPIALAGIGAAGAAVVDLHSHVYAASVLKHCALGEHVWGLAVGSTSVSEHSSTFAQKKPLPEYPALLHVHVYPRVLMAPTRLVQVACSLHRWAPEARGAHSSMSVQVTPSGRRR